MKKRLLVATLAIAALTPLGAAHANGGVVVSVSTPQFGFRIGAPFYGPPLYAPVYASPPVVMAPPPRMFYPAPVVIAPRPVYFRPAYVPRPRVAYPRVAPQPYYGAPVQQAGYWVPPGHARHQYGRHYQ
jgi:hypothetical protein